MHLTIDADSRVILDTHVTTGARHDNQPYLEQLKRIEKRYRQIYVSVKFSRRFTERQTLLGQSGTWHHSSCLMQRYFRALARFQ